jgi:hypothetical protein
MTSGASRDNQSARRDLVASVVRRFVEFRSPKPHATNL